MSAIATVVDGIITNQTSTTESTTSTQSGGSLDKDAFLQLLVTQMKYQDPLEPTSNTEYISQLATFSELEEMQNLGASMEMQRANNLVGEYVFVNTDNGYVEGMVDYVVYQGGKVYLSIEESLYNIDDLDTVADADYLLAVRLAESFTSELGELPDVSLLTKDNLEDVETLISVYDNMTSYQKGYISNDTLTLFKKYLEAYNLLNPSEEETEENDSVDGDSSGDTTVE